MNNEKRSGYFSRDSIMDLLSDDEIARVTTAETTGALVVGDEYIDLEQLDQGVRIAIGGATPIPMGRVVARKVIQHETWSDIVAQLASCRIAPVHSGASNPSHR
jgi:hypothetical protein